MLKKVLAFVAMLYAAASFAAVDVNKATAAELDGIKGIGPGISGKIVEERKKGSFKDWNDFISRVQGVGETNAAKYSAEGLTVNGAAFKAAAPAAKKEDKPMAKAEEKKGDAKPAAAKEEKKDAKAEAKMKADEAKAKKEADMKAKEAKKNDKPAAKDEKKDAKAEAAKPAAPADAAKK
ncbi:MAG: helix-hairpin-helix domain-containing protein [Burkholderiaceae bacterium]